MTYTHSRTVYLGDTDGAGVVYFARGMQICHEAYEESLAARGISLQEYLTTGKIAIPIVHASIDFFLPIFCGDKLQIQLIAEGLKASEFAIAYKIFTNSCPQKPAIRAQTRHVCIDPQQRNRVSFPKEINEWFRSLPS